MERHAGFVDIHCHLLPGLDDGAVDWKQSLAMAKMADADGIRAIIATPHQLGGYRPNTAHLIRQRLDELKRRLHAADVALLVAAGADLRIEPELVEGLKRDKLLTLADRGRYVLLELPHELYFPLEPVLATLSRAGYKGILSHPERNRGILAKPNVLRTLVDHGCLLQITASSLLGAFGAASRRLGEAMVRDGLAHFVATDAHGVARRRPLMSPAFERLLAISDEATAIELCCDNPRRIFEGKTIVSGRRTTKTTRRWFPLSRSA